MRYPVQPAPASAPAHALLPVALVCAVVVIAWVRPEWTLAAAAVAGAGLMIGPAQLRPGVAWVAGGVGVLLLGKDLFPADTAQQWGWLRELPGAPDVSFSRQPAFDLALGSAASWVGLIAWLTMARQVFVADRIRGMFLAVLAVAGASIGLWLLMQPVGSAEGVRHFVFGAVQSRNAMGVALAMAALVAAGAAFEAGTRRELNRCALWMALGAVAAWAAVASGSRGAWLALVAGVAVLIWGVGRQRRLLFTAVPVALAAAGVILWLEPQAAARVGEIGREYRWEIWRAAARVATDHAWLGAGSGMFEPVFAWNSGLQPPVGATIRHPDSSWVLLGFEHGVVGVVLVAVAVGLVLRGRAKREREAGRWGARAAVAAWLVAACFDISLHRPALLAMAVPLIGVAWPAATWAPVGRWSGLLLSSGVLLAAGWTLGCEHALARSTEPVYAKRDGGVQLTAAGMQVLRERPVSVDWQHRLGREAFIAGDFALAARHWRMVLALQPANEEGIRAYARALQQARPAEALPFWEHYFRHAEDRAASRLETTLNESGRTDTAFWRRAIRDRPELLVLLADEDRPEARAAFDDWMRLDLARRGEVPMRYVVVAFARWGEAPEFAKWVHAAPRWPWGEGLQAAQALLEGGRSDLAWPLLARMVKRPAPVQAVARSVAGELLARVQPGDYARLAEALGAGGLSGGARVAALQAAVMRPDCPPWFRVELAYSLAAEGRRIEAGRELWQAARRMADAQPGDW